jgi:dGTP triphosphohydrolase
MTPQDARDVDELHKVIVRAIVGHLRSKPLELDAQVIVLAMFEALVPAVAGLIGELEPDNVVKFISENMAECVRRAQRERETVGKVH